jgi:hypothetical protein
MSQILVNSNFDHTVSSSLACVNTSLRVFRLSAVGQGAGRAFFLVDKQGIVHGKEIGEDLAIFPNEVLAQGAQQMAEKPWRSVTLECDRYLLSPLPPGLSSAGLLLFAL